MGEENRCKKCNKPIDGDGNLCTSCRINVPPKDYFPVDMKQLQIETQHFEVQHAKKMEKFVADESIQPPKMGQG